METAQNFEIEQVFNKIEKVPYGRVLVSLFKENTEGWEIKDNSVYGKVEKIKYGSYIPIMRLSPPDPGEAKSSLEIFNGIENPQDPHDYCHPNLRLYAGVCQGGSGASPEINMGIFFDLIDFNFPKNWGEERLKYNSYLMEIAKEANSKAKQVVIPKEKEDEVMEKWERCGGCEAGYVMFGEIFSL